jgi:LuxR family transcriptional regulator, maltose regulon positive regulatory protein
MVGSRTSSRDDAAVGERDDLLATKLNLPHTRPDHLGRSRLIQQLDEGMAREVTLVCTPAGFGKTTLLADWAAGARWRVAWLSLDPEDNDSVRFWRYVIVALDRVCEGLGELLALLTPPGAMSSQGVVTALVNRLQAQPDEIALVLDDYHLIGSRPVHDGMAYLLGHLPPQLHVVISSRSDPPLPLARLRARGQLVELRTADLRFTPEEAAALLREAWGLDLTPETMAALAGRTEGWAVGLQLAALSLRERPDPDAFLGAFVGTHRYVLDYLSEEVLERQPGHRVRFLLETSILERLSGPLCDAVTGRSDGQDLLEELERANLFLIPLDEERRWWRYHHLFADLLRARLQQADPARVTALHRAAADWCERHELGDDAIRHALDADDPEWAARLIERHLEEQILRRSEGATIARWLAALPAEVVRSRPRLCFGQALTALLRGRADEAESLLDAVERAADSAAEEPYEPSVGRAASILANLPAVTAVGRADLARLRGDPEREAGFARQALACLTEQDGMQLGAFARYHLAMANWLGGRLDEAERGLAEVVADRAAAGERYLAVRAGWDLGHIQQAQGRLGAACAPTNTGWSWLPNPATRHCPPPVWPRSAWPRCGTNATSWQRPWSMPPPGSRSAASSPTPHRWPPAWSPWPGSATPRVIRTAPCMPSTRPRGPCPTRPWWICSTPCRHNGPGCCSPAATRPQPCALSGSAASAPTTSPTTPTSVPTCCWPASCWPSEPPAGRSRCSAGCTPWPRRRGG